MQGGRGTRLIMGCPPKWWEGQLVIWWWQTWLSSDTGSQLGGQAGKDGQGGEHGEDDGDRGMLVANVVPWGLCAVRGWTAGHSSVWLRPPSHHHLPFSSHRRLSTPASYLTCRGASNFQLDIAIHEHIFEPGARIFSEVVDLQVSTEDFRSGKTPWVEGLQWRYCCEVILVIQPLAAAATECCTLFVKNLKWNLKMSWRGCPITAG